MTDRIFIDTNILVYAYVTTDSDKHEKTKNFLNSLQNKEVFISTQVLNEVYSALRKNNVNEKDIVYYIEYCIDKYNILSVTLEKVKTCLAVREKYNYSYWDSLILAAAVNNNCTHVYSEDMQDSHVIYSKLKIITL